MKNKFFLVMLFLVLVSNSAFAEPANSSVNINLADAKTLATLTGIGTARAEAIIRYREIHGEFKTPEEITRVSGVGQGILNDNLDRIIVTGE